MLLITGADVRSVYETDRDDEELQPFLAVTQAFTDDRLAGKLSNAVLREVQRYLAAHFLFVTDTGVHDSLRVEDVSEHFTGYDRQPGLLDSRWGRMSVALDSSGTLSSLSRLGAPAELRIIPQSS
jgi:hypothetical protein